MPRVTDQQLALLREYASVAWNDPDAQERAEAIRALLVEVDQRRQEVSRWDVVCRLMAAVRASGGQTAFRQAHPMSPGYLSDALSGEAEFGPKILAAIGVRKRTVTVYELIDDEAEPLPAPRPIAAAAHEGVAP